MHKYRPMSLWLHQLNPQHPICTYAQSMHKSPMMSCAVYHVHMVAWPPTSRPGSQERGRWVTHHLRCPHATCEPTMEAEACMRAGTQSQVRTATRIDAQCRVYIDAQRRVYIDAQCRVYSATLIDTPTLLNGLGPRHINALGRPCSGPRKKMLEQNFETHNHPFTSFTHPSFQPPGATSEHPTTRREE